MQICQPSTQFALKNDDTNKAKKTVKAHLHTRKANGTQRDNKHKPPKQRNGRHSGKNPTNDEEVTLTRICKHQQDAKVSIIAAEMSEGVRKSTAKNKVSFQLCMHYQKPKNQASKQMNNCAHRI